MCLLCIVSCHQELVVELREESFDSSTESFVSPYCRPPVFLIKPIRNLKGYMCRIEKILLYVSTEISLVSQHQTIAVLPFDIIKIMQVMYVCRSHVIGINYPINAENIFPPINGKRYVFTDFLTQTVSLLTSLIILASGNKIRECLQTFVVQTMKQIVLTVNAEDFWGGGQCHYFQIGEFGDGSSARHISQAVYTFSCRFFEYVENFSELYGEVVHKCYDSN